MDKRQYKEFSLPDTPDDLIREFDDLVKKIESGNLSAFAFVEKAYEFCDHYAVFLSPYTVCSKGCSHCCNIRIDITSLEADYIVKNLNVSFCKKRNLLKQFRDRLLKRGIKYSFAKAMTPCPFLTRSNICGIYKYRPFVCRTYHTFIDPELCKNGEKQPMFGSPINNYGNLRLGDLASIFLNASNNEYKDIRGYFGKDPVKVNTHETPE